MAFFRATSDDRQVKHKPDMLQVSVTDGSGKPRKFELATKISQNLITRQHNTVSSLDSVWMDSKAGEIFINVRETMGKDVMCLSLADTGFLAHVVTKGGTTEGRQKQRYVLLKRNGLYKLSAYNCTVTKMEMRSRNGDIRSLDFWSKDSAPQEQVSHIGGDLKKQFTQPSNYSSASDASPQFSSPHTFKMYDSSASQASDLSDSCFSDSSHMTVPAIPVVPIRQVYDRQASLPNSTWSIPFLEQPNVGNFQWDDDSTSFSDELGDVTNNNNDHWEMCSDFLQDTPSIHSFAPALAPAPLTQTAPQANTLKRSRDSDSLLSSTSTPPQKKRSQPYKMSPKSWNVNIRAAPFRVTITSPHRWEGQVQVAFAGEFIPSAQVDVYKKTIIVEVPPQQMPNKTMLKFQIVVDVEVFVGGARKYKTHFKYKFGATNNDDSDSESDNDEDDEDDNFRDRDQKKEDLSFKGLVQKPNGNVRLYASFDSLSDFNELFQHQSLKAGLCFLVQNHINSGGRQSFLDKVQGCNSWRVWLRKTLKTVSKNAAKASTINHFDSAGFQLLHYATALGMSETVTFLIAQGANVDSVGKQLALTPVDLARSCKINSREITCLIDDAKNKIFSLAPAKDVPPWLPIPPGGSPAGAPSSSILQQQIMSKLNMLSGSQRQETFLDSNKNSSSPQPSSLPSTNLFGQVQRQSASSAAALTGGITLSSKKGSSLFAMAFAKSTTGSPPTSKYVCPPPSTNINVIKITCTTASDTEGEEAGDDEAGSDDSDVGGDLDGKAALTQAAKGTFFIGTPKFRGPAWRGWRAVAGLDLLRLQSLRCNNNNNDDNNDNLRANIPVAKQSIYKPSREQQQLQQQEHLHLHEREHSGEGSVTGSVEKVSLSSSLSRSSTVICSSSSIRSSSRSRMVSRMRMMRKRGMDMMDIKGGKVVVKGVVVKKEELGALNNNDGRNIDHNKNEKKKKKKKKSKT